MEILLSVALLALFIVGVELTSMGWTDGGLADRLTGLFSSRMDMAWPSGVQEDDDHRWPARVDTDPGIARSWHVDSAELVEGGVRPVPVCRVRRTR